MARNTSALESVLVTGPSNWEIMVYDALKSSIFT